jgi:hypothetical protein
MNMLLLLAAAAAVAKPQPAELQVYQDWIVGCDNGRACQAVGLVPENDPENWATMSVRRGPEPGASPEIAFDTSDEAGLSLAADGRPLGVKLVMDGYERKVSAADVPKVLAALRSGARFELSGGEAVQNVSLAGASAALLYMDDQQKRVGTVTALVRPGSKPASTVPAPPPLPVVRAVRVGATLPPEISSADMKRIRQQQECTLEDVGGPDSYEAIALDARRTLVLLACGSGAYNVSTLPLIVERRAGRLRAVPASFDAGAGYEEGGKPFLTNGGWDQEKSLLTAFAKGRGLGDCGTGTTHAWDGTRFRLVEQIEMGECRGSIDYITTWRATVTGL